MKFITKEFLGVITGLTIIGELYYADDESILFNCEEEEDAYEGDVDYDKVRKYLTEHDSCCITIDQILPACKKYAFENGFWILESAFVAKGKFTSSYCKAEKSFTYPTLKQTFHADTETEAVVEAVKWILILKENNGS